MTVNSNARHFHARLMRQLLTSLTYLSRLPFHSKISIYTFMTALVILVSSILVLEEAINMGNSFSSGEKCEKCGKINIAVVRFNNTIRRFCWKSLLFYSNAAKRIFFH